MDAGRYASACRKLEGVTRLEVQALGAKLTLVECYEAEGKLASAWSEYALVEQLARNAGQLERAQRAAARAAELAPKLATLSIEVPPALRSTPGLSIKRDGADVDIVAWSVPVPVDSGGHDVEASAPHHAPWRKHVEVAGDGARVIVRVEVTPAAAPVQPVTQALPRAPSVSDPVAHPWWRPTAIATMAVGVAGVAVGAALGGLAIARNNASNEMNRCDGGDRCDSTGLALRNAAQAFGNGSTAAFALGGVILAGGVVLFATAPGPKREEQRGAAFVLLPTGAAMRGTW